MNSNLEMSNVPDTFLMKVSLWPRKMAANSMVNNGFVNISVIASPTLKEIFFKICILMSLIMLFHQMI